MSTKNVRASLLAYRCSIQTLVIRGSDWADLGAGYILLSSYLGYFIFQAGPPNGNALCVLIVPILICNCTTTTTTSIAGTVYAMAGILFAKLALAILAGNPNISPMSLQMS